MGFLTPYLRFIAPLTLILMVGMVLIRIGMMKAHGIDAMKFAKIDRKDFLILPFVIFYFYTVFALAFDWPVTSAHPLFRAPAVSWLGAVLCLLGLSLLLWSVFSFGRSFRVGIDADRPDALVTTGAFAFSRNPIYVAFFAILVAEFLVFLNWVLLVYILAASWLFHRQVLLEESYLKQHYGPDYADYSQRVRRYF
jgi:protein-S-isoprenylcysteine O-methyltransferase Ste14